MSIPRLPLVSAAALVLAPAAADAQCQLFKVFETAGNHPSIGRAIAADGPHMLTGPGGDMGAVGEGSVHARIWQGGTWSWSGFFEANDTTGGDGFGSGLALSGDTAAIGAPGRDDAASNAGAIYIYQWTEGAWAQGPKLVADDAQPSDELGTVLAMSGDVLAAGAPRHAGDAGAVYVFRFDGVQWSQEAKLTASDGVPGDAFGTALDLDGGVLVVGSEQTGASTGAAYVFEFDGASWNEEQKLIPTGAVAGDLFGQSVALDGSLLLIGAAHIGFFSDHPGSVYVFEEQGGAWSQTQRLEASDATDGDEFGVSVALRGDLALIGANAWEAPNGDGEGSAYLFREIGGTWVEDDRFQGRDTDGGDSFGRTVALAGDFAFVGATGADGLFSNVGATYGYSLLCDIDVYGCTAPDKALSIVSGNPIAGDVFTIGLTNTQVTQSPGSTLPLVAISLQPDPAYPCGTPVFGWDMTNGLWGELLVGDPLLFLSGPPWPGFNQPTPVAIPVPNEPILFGVHVYAAGFLIDSGPTGFPVTNTPAVRMKVGAY